MIGKTLVMFGYANKKIEFEFEFVFSQSVEARCYVENEDVVGAAPTGDAPTTSEWPKMYCLLRCGCY